MYRANNLSGVGLYTEKCRTHFSCFVPRAALMHWYPWAKTGSQNVTSTVSRIMSALQLCSPATKSVICGSHRISGREIIALSLIGDNRRDGPEHDCRVVLRTPEIRSRHYRMSATPELTVRLVRNADSFEIRWDWQR